MHSLNWNHNNKSPPITSTCIHFSLMSFLHLWDSRKNWNITAHLPDWHLSHLSCLATNPVSTNRPRKCPTTFTDYCSLDVAMVHQLMSNPVALAAWLLWLPDPNSLQPSIEPHGTNGGFGPWNSWNCSKSWWRASCPLIVASSTRNPPSRRDLPM